jgi:hypothetical protein
MSDFKKPESEVDVIVQVQSGFQTTFNILSGLTAKIEGYGALIDGLRVRMESITYTQERINRIVEGDGKDPLLIRITKVESFLDTLHDKFKEIKQSTNRRESAIIQNKGLIIAAIMGGILGLLSTIVSSILHFMK